MIKEAKELLKMGFSVIPLKPKSKESSIKWKKYQDKHPKAGEINNWFPNGSKKILGIIVLDVDGEEGQKSLDDLGGIPYTPHAETSRGYHIYFKHPGFRVNNHAGMHPGLDLRGDGGYIVAPPSVHPGGHIYEWILCPLGTDFADPPD